MDPGVSTGVTASSTPDPHRRGASRGCVGMMFRDYDPGRPSRALGGIGESPEGPARAPAALWRLMRRGADSAAVVFFLVGPGLGAARAVEVTNPYSDELLRLPPNARAAALARRLGLWCIGSNPFLMGVTQTGPAKGYAYWSLDCAGSKSYAIQIAPDGAAVVIDCDTLKTHGGGRECFHKF
jgi:hypothetical protein